MSDFVRFILCVCVCGQVRMLSRLWIMVLMASWCPITELDNWMEFLPQCVFIYFMCACVYACEFFFFSQRKSTLLSTWPLNKKKLWRQYDIHSIQLLTGHNTKHSVSILSVHCLHNHISEWLLWWNISYTWLNCHNRDVFTMNTAASIKLLLLLTR